MRWSQKFCQNEKSGLRTVWSGRFAFRLLSVFLLSALCNSQVFAQDVSKPHLSSFRPQANPASFNTGIGNGFLEIHAALSDSGTGVNYLEATFHPLKADGSVNFDESIVGRWQLALMLVDGTINDGTFSLLLRIPKGTASNTFFLHSITLFDQAGNHSRYFSNPLPGESALPATAYATIQTVNTGVVTTSPSTSQDVAPPAITGVSFSPASVDVSSGQAFVDIEIEARDDYSGISQVDAWFLAPDGSQISFGGNANAAESVVTGGPHDGCFHVRVAIPEGAIPGDWSLQGVLISDASGNTTLRSDNAEVLAVANSGSSQVNNPAPDAPTPFSVSAQSAFITGVRPIFSWSLSERATHYQIYVRKEASGGATATVTWDTWFEVVDTAQHPTPLSAGNYKWWVRAWSPAGYSNWSAPMTFSVDKLLPEAPIINPASNLSSFNLGDGLPKLSWQSAKNATWYQVWINKDGKTFHRKWVKAEDGVSYEVDLGAGSYAWWVQAYNPDGVSAWTYGGNFAVNGAKPGKVTLIGPNSTSLVAGNDVLLEWAKLNYATWYRLWINKDGVKYFDGWLKGGGTTSYLLPSAESGSYKFWVIGWNPMGYGAWSNPKQLEIQ